ncbi:MAG: hypothetical protein ACK4ON_11370 [Bacteroidia bacterium]
MKKHNMVFVVLMFFLSSLYAQDILQKRNESSLEVKIIEIGTDEIKYRLWEDLEGPIYVVEKKDVSGIKLQNGEQVTIEPDVLAVSESSASHKRRAIKLEPFSLFAGHISGGYEHWLKPGIALEGKIGLIGVGLNQAIREEQRKGAFLKAGMKFTFRQLVYNKGARIVHPLAGGYFKPEISISHFTNQREVYIYSPSWVYPSSETVKFRNTSAALNLILGKQWLVGDVILLDIYGGIGYGYFQTKSTKNLPAGYDSWDLPGYYHSHVGINNDFPLTFTSGFSLGVLIK